MNIEKFDVTLTLTEPLLASQPGNKELLAAFVASKASSEDKKQEEIDVSQIHDKTEKLSTVFARDDNGIFLWDYQIRGMIKEALKTIIEIGDDGSLSKWTVGQAVDRMLFVKPRRVYICRDGSPLKTFDGHEERSLRAQTPQGERVCLARSQRVDVGYVTFRLELFRSKDPKSKQNITPEALEKALNYGEYKGLGQWRSGGFGRFTNVITTVKDDVRKAG